MTNTSGHPGGDEDVAGAVAAAVMYAVASAVVSGGVAAALLDPSGALGSAPSAWLVVGAVFLCACCISVVLLSRSAKGHTRLIGWSGWWAGVAIGCTLGALLGWIKIQQAAQEFNGPAEEQAVHLSAS